MDIDTAKLLVDSRKWYHGFEIIPGLITPGQSKWDPEARLDQLGVPKDLKDEKALDIATWDGPLAFAFESRGATTVATDIQDPDVTAFNTAKKIRDSQISYTRCSVYDLTTHFEEDTFDRAGFLGVFYHLKYPILAFEQIARVLKIGGKVHFEGEILASYMENLDGTKNSTLDPVAIGESEVPLTACYPGKFKGGSNWHTPNMACLRAWLQSSGLELEDFQLNVQPQREPYPVQRVLGTAVKRRKVLLEHPIVDAKKYRRSD
jgi:tRNA (mo5U34)-methyltransferase